MELTIAEIAALVGIAGGLSVLWMRLGNVIRWRATVDAELARLTENKERLYSKFDDVFAELKEIKQALQDHVVECARDKAELHTKLDVLIGRTK